MADGEVAGVAADPASGAPHGRRLLSLVTPPIVLLWMSTMYLRYHYGVDVLAVPRTFSTSVTASPVRKAAI